VGQGEFATEEAAGAVELVEDVVVVEDEVTGVIEGVEVGTDDVEDVLPVEDALPVEDVPPVDEVLPVEDVLPVNVDEVKIGVLISETTLLVSDDVEMLK